MKSKQVAFGLCLLVLLWVGNVFYYQKQQLSEPLFFKHYYDILFWGDRISFDLYYLVNNQDASLKPIFQVPGIEIPFFRWTEVSQEKFAYHTLKRVQFELDRSLLGPLSSKDQLYFSELLVHYPGVGVRTVNIGSIRIALHPQTGGQLRFGAAGSSTDNSGFVRFRTEQALKIVGFENPLADQLSDRLKIRINNMDLQDIVFPLKFERDDTVTVDYAFFASSREDALPDRCYGASIRLNYETATGEKGYGHYFLHYVPYLENRDILRIVHERRNGSAIGVEPDFLGLIDCGAQSQDHGI